MRKYYQLLLFILSVVSILCFVFYKHEYDRLRKVLEVLDFFGPSVTESDQKAVRVEDPCLNGSLEFIPDYWHSYAEDVHIYSAFKVANEKGWSLNSVAVVNKNSSSLLKRSSCALISGEVIDDKFEGTIEWKKIEKDGTSSAYSVVCNVPEMIGSSHLFSLYDSKVALHTLNIPLHLGPAHPKDHAVSLCVLSKDPFWHVGDLVDFIQYYAILGVNNFYFYHRGIGDQVISVLKEFVHTRGGVTIHLAMWNRPSGMFSSLDFALVNQDCSWRHGAKTGPAVTLQFGHFLVLPKSSRLEEFLVKLSDRKTESSYEVRIPLQSVCFNASGTETSPIRLPKLNLKKKEIGSGPLRWTEAPNHPGNAELIKVDPHVAKLLTFESCSTQEIAKEDDPVLRHFSAFASKIIQFKLQ